MSDDIARPEELLQIDYKPDKKPWTDPSVEFRKGSYNYGSNPASVEYLGLPYVRALDPRDEDWNLPQEVPFSAGVHGYLRPMWGLRGQVPFLPGIG